MIPLKLRGYANNLPDGTVDVLCEGEKNKIEELIRKIKENPPRFSWIESTEPEWQEYIGDLKESGRKGEDVPKKGATLDDVVEVLTKMDMKLEVRNEILESISNNPNKFLFPETLCVNE